MRREFFKMTSAPFSNGPSAESSTEKRLETCRHLVYIMNKASAKFHGRLMSLLDARAFCLSLPDCHYGCPNTHATDPAPPPRHRGLVTRASAKFSGGFRPLAPRQTIRNACYAARATPGRYRTRCRWNRENSGGGLRENHPKKKSPKNAIRIWAQGGAGGVGAEGWR